MKSLLVKPFLHTAIILGHKTQTRRFQTNLAVGDIAYIKEPFRVAERYDAYCPNELTGLIKRDMLDYMICYPRIDKYQCKLMALGRYRSPLHMPAALARTFLRITAVEDEVLHMISESDAEAEGVEKIGTQWKNYSSGPLQDTASSSFYTLWCSIHGNIDWMDAVVKKITFELLTIEEVAELKF